MELTLKVWKRGSPGGNSLFKALLHGSLQQKLTKKEKVSKPQVSKQVPLEMGTGGGGGEKGGIGGKKPPEDKIEIKDHPSENEEDDSSSETSFELNVDPQQLALVRLHRQLLRLRLTLRRRVTTAAPGGGGTPPPLGGVTEIMLTQERQNGTGYNQPVEGAGGPPQPPDGGVGGTSPLLSQRGRRIPQ